jgi:hypothetical protein
MHERHALEIAHDVLRLMPRHLGSLYVFWQEINGAAAPVFGLSLELAEVFDMSGQNYATPTARL